MLSLASLVPFAMLWPALQAMPITSPLNPSAPAASLADLIPLIVVFVLGAGSFALTRAWLDLAVLAWLEVVLLSLREVYPWDLLTLLTWLVAPVVTGVRPAVVRWTRLLVFVAVAVLAFNNELVPRWLTALA